MDVMSLIDELNGTPGDKAAVIDAKLAESERRVEVLLALRKFVGHNPVAAGPVKSPGKSPADPNMGLGSAGPSTRTTRAGAERRRIAIAEAIRQKGPLKTAEAAKVIEVNLPQVYTYLKTPYFACEDKRWTLPRPGGKRSGPPTAGL